MVLRACLAATMSLVAAVPVLAAEYAVEVRQDLPFAWWRFQDAASTEGGETRDELGRHPGVYHGGVTLDSGPPGIGGRAARFDGRRAYLEIPHDESLSSPAFSAEVWFQSRQAWQARQWPGSATLLSKATATPGSSDWTINAGAVVSGENEGRIVTSIGAAGSGCDVNLVSGRQRNDGQWHHLVWTRSAAGVNRLYLDGRLADEAEDGGGSIANDRPLQMGGDPHQRGTYLEGALAEAALYPAELSADRVRAHALAGGLAVPAAAASPLDAPPAETVTLQNTSGVRWDLWRGPQGWSLGQIFLHGQALERPAVEGVLALRDVKTGDLRWLPAQEMERLRPGAVRLSGQAAVGAATCRFAAEIALPDTGTAAIWTVSWTVDRDVAGWEVCVAPWHRSAHAWRCWLYPFAGNSTVVDVAPLRYCGVPAALLYRPDMSALVLFGIDPASDYLHPENWTGQTGFHFRSLQAPPQFRCGGGGLAAGVPYRLPLQLIFSAAGESAAAITQVVNGWLHLNRYQVEPLRVRTPDAALAIFAAGRRASPMWQPGQGYQIQDAWPVIYVPESPINAYLDYRLYEQTEDTFWRDRAFQIMDFVQRAQHVDPAEPSFGAIESHYNLAEGVFASTDRGGNPGLKPDMNAFAARYTLLLWERVKQREGLDRQDWRTLGVRLADWVVKQQRPDGGLPQVVGPHRQRNAVSVVSGRALVALPVVRRITGDARYDAFIQRHEQFVRTQVEGRLWFTGAHTDLPPGDYEADSIWQVVEYWLDKHEARGEHDALQRAEADALLALLMMCPRQLAWVRNPTQTCHAEQQHYLQYSNYCYTNAKIACLHRLARLTGRPLYGQLCDRVVQSGFWSQETAGPWAGALYERLSDPWRGVSQDVNSRGTRYMSELAVDLQLQLIELALARLERVR